MTLTFRPALILALLAAAALPIPATAQSAFFDLAGPDMEASVTRGDDTLRLAQVPALQEGDRIRVKPLLPPDQSERYLLVVAFLRGVTNPPPESWFHRARTWRRGEDAIEVEVPEGAQQAIVFLAPNTGGGFDAIRDAVRGRPGIFVRAARDLGQASIDRTRLDAFVAGVQRVGETAPDRIQAASTTLARSLAVQLDAECLRRQPRSQAACLTQSRDSIVLYNSRGTSLAETLTGAPADLAYRVSTTPAGGAGAYSPYISVVRDIGRLLGAFQSADYQYIPALAVPSATGSGLLLNTAPSFEAPQSVLVAALPPVGTASLAAPRLASPPGALCAADPRLMIPVEDAPLLFSTPLARQLRLRVAGTEVPLVADALRGGLVPAPGAQVPAVEGQVEAELRGAWGFEPMAPVPVMLAGGDGGAWRLTAQRRPERGGDVSAEMQGGNLACVAAVAVQSADGTERAVPFTMSGERLTATVPGSAVAGASAILIRQHGRAAPASVPFGGAVRDRPQIALLAKTVTVPARPVGIRLIGDDAVPAGGRLTFSATVPEGASLQPDDSLELRSASGGAARLSAGEGYRLQDRRVAVASVEPSAVLGASAFGLLEFRLVRGDATSAWQPLGTLVRLPVISAATCARGGPCRISGSDLFLIDAVATDPGFIHAVPVPSGFTQPSIAIPVETVPERLHLRLRDLPDGAAVIDLPS
ncbi:hypothetical protein GGR88_000697 [Sphingomonas jejuensis]|uniref:Uncharacterized protein n=1 Tax=Sphingomonas jejuensis TaxID=904715 RepID=A0ABX0XIR1_9SPHN|nr:hypothetical protein [Sphingomonas jejuensis]NJC33223.1 hypothetical protein [Sphingomonas jejuensis]